MSILELMLALALLALIAGGLASSVGLGLRLYDRSKLLDVTGDQIAARIRLRSLLIAAQPPSQQTAFATSFLGTQTGFTFTTLAGRGLSKSAAALRVTVRETDRILELDIRLLDDAGAEAPLLSAALASGISGLNFDYLDGSQTPPRWVSDWENRPFLPALISIDALPGSSPEWPEFTVHPRLGQ